MTDPYDESPPDFPRSRVKASPVTARLYAEPALESAPEHIIALEADRSRNVFHGLGTFCEPTTGVVQPKILHKNGRSSAEGLLESPGQMARRKAGPSSQRFERKIRSQMSEHPRSEIREAISRVELKLQWLGILLLPAGTF